MTAMTAGDYERDGFLVVPSFLDAASCEALVARARELVETWDPGQQRSIFTTHEQTRTSDEYFLGSGTEVRFFFEEDGFRYITLTKQVKVNYDQIDLVYASPYGFITVKFANGRGVPIQMAFEEPAKLLATIRYYGYKAKHRIT